MSKVLKEFNTIMLGDYGNLILYTGVVGLALSNKIPTPNALLGTITLKNIKKEYDKGDISFFEFKERSEKTLNIYKNIWWGGVLATTFFVKGDVYQKAKVGGILIGIGIVASMFLPKVDLSANVIVDSPEEENEVNFNAIPNVRRKPQLIL
jgi:hypothetical protein